MLSDTIPTIGIDCRFAGTHSGIGRYTRELVRALLDRHDPWKYVLFVCDPKNHGLGELPRTENVQFSAFNVQHYSLPEQLHFPHRIRASGVALMHFPHFNTPLFCPTPFIATIHDLILHKFPNAASLPKRLAYRFLMRSTVQRATHLIAVSNATASDLAATYGEDVRKKLSVIHEGISPQFQRATHQEIESMRKKYRLPPSFLLFVGVAKEHKNVQVLIDACPDAFPLVLVTGGKGARRLRLRPNVCLLEGVPDNDLSGLYSAASCLVSPSLAEGFNFPILEAMACGCPVIATNRGATPEICGGQCVLVEPTLDGLAKGIRNMENGEWPKAPVGRMENDAMKYAQSFTWKKAAEETAKAYVDMLKKGRYFGFRVSCL